MAESKEPNPEIEKLRADLKKARSIARSAASALLTWCPQSLFFKIHGPDLQQWAKEEEDTQKTRL